MELIGLLLPALVDLINRKVANSDARFWVSVSVCAAVGVGLNYIDTLFVFDSLRTAFDSLTTTILVVFGWAQLSYKAIYEDSRLQDTIRSK